MKSALASGNAVALAGAAFLAVYREGIETILFYKALIDSAAGALSRGGRRASRSARSASPIVYVLYMRLGARLPMRQFFLVTGGAALLPGRRLRRKGRRRAAGRGLGEHDAGVRGCRASTSSASIRRRRRWRRRACCCSASVYALFVTRAPRPPRRGAPPRWRSKVASHGRRQALRRAGRSRRSPDAGPIHVPRARLAAAAARPALAARACRRPPRATVYHSRDEALQLAFPDAERVEPKEFFLTAAQRAAIEAAGQVVARVRPAHRLRRLPRRAAERLRDLRHAHRAHAAGDVSRRALAGRHASPPRTCSPSTSRPSTRRRERWLEQFRGMRLSDELRVGRAHRRHHRLDPDRRGGDRRACAGRWRSTPCC